MSSRLVGMDLACWMQTVYLGPDNGRELAVFHQALMGICSLHSLGYMHRDITVRNIAIITLTPPEATLLDFGKTVKISKELQTDTGIGPKNTLAPEVWSKNGYTETVDLWAWAYAIADVILYNWRGKLHIHQSLLHDQIQRGHLVKIHSWLKDAALKTPAYGKLISLLCDVLQWEPSVRPSVKAALNHPCWQTDMQTEGIKPPEAKRRRIAEEQPVALQRHQRSPPAAVTPAPGSVRTEPFSSDEETSKRKSTSQTKIA